MEEFGKKVGGLWKKVEIQTKNLDRINPQLTPSNQLYVGGKRPILFRWTTVASDVLVDVLKIDNSGVVNPAKVVNQKHFLKIPNRTTGYNALVIN